MHEMSNDELVKHLDAVCKAYRGDATQLETAVGMFVLGRTMGWRVMYLIHSASTVRKYEKILNLKLREVLPEYTEESKRSNAYMLLKISDSIKNFWKVVNGVYPNIKSTQLSEPDARAKRA